MSRSARPRAATVAVRISMHLGIPQIDPHDPNNFVGKPVDYAARLSDYATGGQILVSRSVVAVLEDAGMDGVSFHRHGQRELKGIGRGRDLRAGVRRDRAAADAAAAARKLVAAVDGVAGDDGADGVSGGSAQRVALSQQSATRVGRRDQTTDVVPATVGQLRARGAAGQRRHGRCVSRRGIRSLAACAR